MADEKHEDVRNLSRRRFLVSATAAAGLVTTASGLTLLGGASSVAAQTAAPSSVTVSVPFGGFAAYSFQNDAAYQKIGITMTYSPSDDPKDKGATNAKAAQLDVFGPASLPPAGKAIGSASGTAGKKVFQIASSVLGQYVLVVHNWDSMKRTISVTLNASYVDGAAIALKAVSGAATEAAPAQASSAQVAWPFPYKKLDPEVVRVEAHKGYYAAGCCYGAFHGMLTVMKKEIGGPYLNIPTEMMKFGEGGGVGWGTLCGALNGAAAVINMALPDDGWRPIINDLFSWYANSELPTDISNQYAEEGKFIVEKLKYEGALPQNVAHSPLCHASVTNWCQLAGVNVADAQRLERCGRVTGDVAAQATIMMNAYLDKTFKASFKLDETSAGCVTCHSSKVHPEMGGVVNTKMECAPCHGENPHAD